MQNEIIKVRINVYKGADEEMSESTVRWYGHTKRMDASRVVKRALESELTVVRRVDRLHKS